MLKIGISEINITPELGLRVAGMLNPPKAEGVKWPLFVRIFMFDDGISRAAIVIMDNLLIAPPLISELRQLMSLGTTLAPADIMITCTHTHRAPFLAALMDEEIDFGYLDFIKPRLVDGMAQAWAARQPARIKAGRIDAPGWTFNRRQVYKSERYGEQVGTQGPQAIPGFLHNEGPEDNELKVITIETLDGKCLGGMVNFACHTTVMGGEPVYSADFAGPLTELLSRQYGGIFAFLQGAAGNLWAINTTHTQDRLAKDYMGPDHAERMAKGLAKKAEQAIQNGKYISNERVRIQSEILCIPQRRPTTEQVKLARWYLEKVPVEIDQQEFTRQIYDHDYTFYNNDPVVQEWFARETIGMWEWQRRAGIREPFEIVEIQVIGVGDIAFTGYPGELFTEFGLITKAESPFRETLVIELANGWHGYIPTQQAFTHGGYETRLGYTSRLVPEAGDRMYETALKLLNFLAGK